MAFLCLGREVRRRQIESTGGHEVKLEYGQYGRTVGYRLPVCVYDEAVRRAQEEGVKLSVVLRRATLIGLEVEAAAREKWRPR